MKDRIKKELSKFLNYVGDVKLTELGLEHNVDPILNGEKKQYLDKLQLKVSIIECWLILLNYDERMVIEDHLIRGLSWENTVEKYNARWGPEHNRTKRTLMKYQAAGIQKIANFAECYSDILDCVLFDRTSDVA